MPPSNSSSRHPSWLLPLLLLLFFGSGVCALIYQVMWLRLLSLVFGVTVYAGSTVLAGFMAGLGLGSFLGGRFAATFSRPLVAFGVAEALVGVTAFATPFALDALTAIWIAVYPQLPQSLALLTVIRFVVAFLVLIVPTSLMGATLPLVIKSAVAREQRVGGRIGLLYAINTTGAITGALVAGFYFISELGVSRSFQIAAAANIAIGVDRDRRRPPAAGAADCRDRIRAAPSSDRLGDDATAPGAVDVLRVGRDVARAGDHLVPDAGRLPAARPRTPLRSCSRACSAASRSAARSLRRCCGGAATGWSSLPPSRA